MCLAGRGEAAANSGATSPAGVVAACADMSQACLTLRSGIAGSLWEGRLAGRLPRPWTLGGGVMIRTALDPVCEMEIRPEDAVAIARFEGHRVYFCSENCYKAFLDLPHSFVGWADDLGRQRGRRRFRLNLRHALRGGDSSR